MGSMTATEEHAPLPAGPLTVADLEDLPGPPLLAVEVLSPSTQLFDRNLKKAAHERMGAAHFWLVDPRVPELYAYELDAGGRYRLVAHVTGDDPFSAERPFRVTVRP